MKYFIVILLTIKLFIGCSSYHLFEATKLDSLKCKYYQGLPLSGILSYEVISVDQSFFNVFISDNIKNCHDMLYQPKLSIINTTYASLQKIDYDIKSEKIYLLITSNNKFYTTTLAVSIQVEDIKTFKSTISSGVSSIWELMNSYLTITIITGTFLLMTSFINCFLIINKICKKISNKLNNKKPKVNLINIKELYENEEYTD